MVYFGFRWEILSYDTLALYSDFHALFLVGLRASKKEEVREQLV